MKENIQTNDKPSKGINDPVEDALISILGAGYERKYVRFFMAALSSLPWIGGVLSAMASFSAEKDQEKINDLLRIWLMEHKEKYKEFNDTVQEIFGRLDGFGDEIKERMESPEYLTLVRKTFRSWDQADTKDKRQMLKKLITNAGAIKLCEDDLIRLFIHWIELYHEAHFLVVKEIYKNTGITRGGIWDKIHDSRPREDSANADLFRYLIRDLSTGGVIRQQRETNIYGQFVKKNKGSPTKNSASKIMESAFENIKPYELTELGKQFVHYVMEDVVPQLVQSPQ